MDALWGSEQVAEQCGVPLATVRRWRYFGQGPRGFRVGRHVRYRASEVARWLTEAEAAEEKRRRSR